MRCPFFNTLRGVGTVAYGLNGFGIGADSHAYVLGATRASFYFEDTHTGMYHLVEEMYCAQILRRHHILVFNVELVARFAIGYGVAASANLSASTTVCAGVHLMEAKIAFSTDGHA